MATLRIGNNSGAGTVGGILDAEISQEFFSSAQGTNLTSYLKSNTSGKISRHLMTLDLTPFGGQTVVVNSASISILNADAVASTRVVELRELLTTFVENQATWNKRDTATNWNVAGALTGTDAGTTVLAIGTMPTTNTRFVISGAGFDTWLQGKINSGATSCSFILSVIDDTTVNDSANRRIVNHEHGTATNRPWCDIDYTVSTPPAASVNSVTVNNLSGVATCVVTLSSPYALPVSYTLASTEDTSTDGVDFVGQSVSVPFAAGEVTKSVDFVILP